MRIKISADSTCDLPLSLIEKYNIGISPLYVVKEGESFRDGLEISAEDIFGYYRQTGKLCTTAAVSLGDYLDTFGEYMKEYDAVIHFTISASMSACWQNARLAAADLGNVYVVDSENLSVGIGVLVLTAARMAEEGKTAEEILAEVEKLKAKVDMTFIIDTLEFLHKGGRCSTVAALGANILKLHPCIEVRGGAMGVGKKYRGNMDKFVSAYLADKLSEGDFDRRIAWVVDSGVPENIRAAAMEQVETSGLFDEVLWSCAGCTICSHCGPNTLGIMVVKN